MVIKFPGNNAFLQNEEGTNMEVASGRWLYFLVSGADEGTLSALWIPFPLESGPSPLRLQSRCGASDTWDFDSSFVPSSRGVGDR